MCIILRKFVIVYTRLSYTKGVGNITRDFNELRLQRLTYLISQCRNFDNKEYVERLQRERDNLLKDLLD